MINAERQVRALQIIRQRGAISVRDLSSILGVSEMTVRRDLRTLESRGEAQRTHGGARAIGENEDIPYKSRSQTSVDEKRRIASRAAEYVEDGDTVFLGVGSTVASMVEELSSFQRLTIVTHSLKVIQSLTPDIRCSVVVLGGTLDTTVYAMVDPSVDSSLSHFRFTRAFLGATGIIPEQGVFNASQSIGRTERLVFERSAEVFVLADNTKFGKSALVEIGPVSAPRTIITDWRLPLETADAVRQAGGHIDRVEPPRP
jgi:DeoR/GlpR family transcriptional regulator of sugar metabolism